MTDEKSLWSLARWANNRGTRAAAFTPDIEKQDLSMAETTKEKAEALKASFFSKPPEANLADIHNYFYLQRVEKWTPIT